MTEQEAYDEWCPEPYRRRIWTAQSQEAARAGFAAAWYAQEKLKAAAFAQLRRRGVIIPVSKATKRAIARSVRRSELEDDARERKCQCSTPSVCEEAGRCLDKASSVSRPNTSQDRG